MKQRLKILISIAVSLVINVLSLLFLGAINRVVETEDDAPLPEHKNIVIKEPPPTKQRRRNPRTTSRRVSPRPRQRSLPNLPSRVSVPGLALTNKPMNDFVDDLVGGLDAVSSDFIFKEEAVDSPPKVIHRAMPKYPWSAEKRGEEGYVVFKIKLSEKGRIEKLWTTESKPPGIFDEAAEKAIRQYRFSPASYKGRPVPVICTQRIVFQLGS